MGSNWARAMECDRVEACVLEFLGVPSVCFSYKYVVFFCGKFFFFFVIVVMVVVV